MLHLAARAPRRRPPLSSNVRRHTPRVRMESLLFWAVLLGGPACAIAAILAARGRSQSHWLNLGTVVAPPVVFFAVAASTGTHDRGLGLGLWPVVVGLVACYAVAAKVFAVDRLPGVSARTTSVAWFFVLSLASVVFALLAPAWLK